MLNGDQINRMKKLMKHGPLLFSDVDRELERVGLVHVVEGKSNVTFEARDFWSPHGGVSAKYVATLPPGPFRRARRIALIARVVNDLGDELDESRAKELANKFGCSTRTIARDWSLVRDTLRVERNAGENHGAFTDMAGEHLRGDP